MGMTSTALDATLCLLLVSAGAVVVSTAPGEPGSTVVGGAASADAAAETVATSTATVNYTLVPGSGAGAEAAPEPRPGSGGTGDRPFLRRTAHGTLAALLADAAMGRVTVGGRRLSRARADLAAGVREAVRAAVGGTHTQVVAVWRPYPGAPVAGRMAVGSRPPPGADVRAATVVAASGAPADGSRAEDGRGYGAVARLAATRTVRTLFPPAATRFALGADHPDPTLVRRRYARAAHADGDG
ncbi:MAG: hypothetical protein ABEH40_07000, partial [Haloferacaceae archaeon]